MTVSVLAAYLGVLIFPAAMIYAALGDLTTMKIPNRLVLALLAAFLLLAPLTGMGFRELLLDAGLAAAVFIVAFFLFGAGWIGGGDAKLATVTALWLGADHLLPYLLYTALFGGALTLLLLQFRLFSLPGSWAAPSWVARLHARETGVPYGVAMAAAGLMVFPQTAWMALIA